MPLLSPAMQSKSTARGKVITQLISWDGSDTDGVVFDFTAQGNAMLLREPVCVFVDNTRGTGQITLSVEGYAYQLVIQPGMIASLPLFSVSLPRVTVKAADGASGLTSIVFCDFMLPNFAFEATGVSQTTTDTILQEVVSGGAGSESLRVTDAGAISALGSILAQLKTTLAVADADVLAQLKTTLAVADADVLAQLKTTLAVADADVLAQLKTTLAVTDADALTALDKIAASVAATALTGFSNSYSIATVGPSAVINAGAFNLKTFKMTMPTANATGNYFLTLHDAAAADTTSLASSDIVATIVISNFTAEISFPAPIALKKGLVIACRPDMWDATSSWQDLGNCGVEIFSDLTA